MRPWIEMLHSNTMRTARLSPGCFAKWGSNKVIQDKDVEGGVKLRAEEQLEEKQTVAVVKEEESFPKEGALAGDLKTFTPRNFQSVANPPSCQHFPLHHSSPHSYFLLPAGNWVFF